MSKDINRKDISSQSNASWLYEKAYFWGIDWSEIKSDDNKQKLKDRNQKILSLRPDTDQVKPLGHKQLKLTTAYPGLLAGSGYIHELGIEGELKLGFSFDYATGLPFIPGSSVKGRLRSCFKEKVFHDYTIGLLEQLVGKLPNLKNKETHPVLEQIEMEIFSSQRLEKKSANGKEKWTYKAFKPSKRDIFYDAFAESANHQGNNSFLNGGMLGDDYLTPHLDRETPANSPFVDPIPLSFLKVLPSVTFEFDFRLQDSELWPALTAEKKCALFREMLLDFGLGAKTNVGYGRLTDEENKERVDWEDQADEENMAAQPEKVETQAELPEVTSRDINDAFRGRRIKYILAMVATIEGANITVKMMLDGKEKEFQITQRNFPENMKGQLVRLKVKDRGNLAKGKDPIFQFGGKVV